MEEIALLSRPELMESRYQKRISSKDTRAAMLALIPSLKFNAAYGYTDNDYLLNQDTQNMVHQLVAIYLISSQLEQLEKLLKLMKNLLLKDI